MTTQLDLINKILKELGGRPPDAIDHVPYWRIILSWVSYWMGHGVSRAVEPVFGHWFEWPHRLYSWLMVKSDDLQSEDPRGPWSPSSP